MIPTNEEKWKKSLLFHYTLFKGNSGKRFHLLPAIRSAFFFLKLRSVKKSILDETIEAARDEEDMTALGSFMTPQGAGSPQK